MDHREESSLGFVQNRLPWLAGAGGLVLYLLTLSHWVRLESLTTVARVAGWDQTPAYFAPIHFLVTWPFRWLPQAYQPVALNVFTALLSAATLVFLARSVALLPFDRTRDERIRERSDFSLLSTPNSWVPVWFAVAAAGLQLSYWEHATSDTGEALDLLLFAYVIRCLLEYRLEHREGWLSQFALVYGLAVTNNYAMIAFFPAFLFALIWIKGLSFFNLGFIGRMLGWGLVGLLPYLLLPAVAVASHATTQSFWSYLRLVLGTQRASLTQLPPYVILLLSFSSIFPVLVRSIRWPSTTGDTNVAGARLASFITRLVNALLLAACISVFFDPKWSPRALGFGFPLLPFYYLAAIGIAYFVGYFLLLYRNPEGKLRHHLVDNSPGLNGLVTGVVMLAALAVPVAEAARNFPVLRRNDGTGLAQLASVATSGLPSQGACLISDDQTELLLVVAGLDREGVANRFVPINTHLLDSRYYHEVMAKRYPAKWPAIPELAKLPDTLEPAIVAQFVASLVRSNQAYYLHSSMGYYFEGVYPVPHGLVQELRLIPANELAAPPLSPAELDANQKLWSAAADALQRLPRLTPALAGEVRSTDAASADAPLLLQMAYREARFVNQLFSAALNNWGVILERHGRAAEAGKYFAQALEVNPANFSARRNTDFNRQLLAGPLKPVDLGQRADLPPQRSIEEVLLADGRFDDPLFTYKLGLVFFQAGLYRQAMAEFQRVHDLLPTNRSAQAWRENLVAMIHFGQGDTATAEREARELRQQYPREDSVLETLTQIYLLSGQFPQAMASIQEQLKLNPANPRALLNQAALSIHNKAYADAIQPMDKLLSIEPENTAALMNRAIAHLQCAHLDGAEKDYEALRKKMPKYSAVYYGLGEIAYRRKDNRRALSNYELYLKYAQAGSDEYKQVAQRVNDLRGGAR